MPFDATKFLSQMALLSSELMNRYIENLPEEARAVLREHTGGEPDLICTGGTTAPALHQGILPDFHQMSIP